MKFLTSARSWVRTHNLSIPSLVFQPLCHHTYLPRLSPPAHAPPGGYVRQVSPRYDPLVFMERWGVCLVALWTWLALELCDTRPTGRRWL